MPFIAIPPIPDSRTRVNESQSACLQICVYLRNLRIIFFFPCLLLGLAAPAVADVAVTDFFGRTVHLEKPAERIVALAPHVVENLYSAGVGDRLVGAVQYSDYPPAARKLPRVGTSARINLRGPGHVFQSRISSIVGTRF